jgi:hypothetical protein
MRFITKILLLTSLAASFAYAQTNLYPQVQHVIVVIQENRTPTNLFHEDAALVANGAHVIPPNNQGACGPMLQNANCTAAMTNKAVTLTGLPLATPVDPTHSHYPAWRCTFDNGAIDGACHIHVSQSGNISGCPEGQLQYCPYSYVFNNMFNPQNGILDPYFHIAEQYGFANWMFQTHQGPSQPAHLFLFSGTSAPVSNDGDAQKYWEWFAAENTGTTPAGCTSANGTVALELPPNQGQFPAEQDGYAPPGGTPGYPCFNHPTLVDLLKPNISWRYYAGDPYSPQHPFAIWRAPDMMQNICQPTPSDLPGDVCTYAGYTTNVYTGNPGVILQDLGAVQNQPCDLQQVSWVIPDGSWSDHPGTGSFDGGPSWVAAIVNAVGGVTNFGANLPNQCKDADGTPYWKDTVVLVVWDDWGGFYDDVLPWNCFANGICNGYTGQGQSADYVYGFRVPLLVVGPYVKQSYVSGACPGGNCQGQEKPPYVHDFGSILNFIEYAFGQGGNPLGYPGGIGGIDYPYADWFAPDAYTSGNCTKSVCPYSLYDFFAFGQTARTFSRITGAKYDTGYFLNPEAYFPNYPSDPDDDAIDPQ